MSSLLKSVIRQFLPDIREKAAPVIQEALIEVLSQHKDALREGEERADIIIENVRGRIVVYICAMTPDNRITRFLHKYELPELVELLLSNIDKI